MRPCVRFDGLTLTVGMIMGLLIPFTATGQIVPYRTRQLTSGTTDHKWPSINSIGNIVWSQLVGPVGAQYWQVFWRESAESITTVQITTTSQNHERPVISDNGDIVYFKDQAGGGIGYQVIRYSALTGAESIIEFSSRNNITGDQRVAGKRFGIASNGTTVSYYDFFQSGSSVRRFNVGGVGQLFGDFTGLDYPDVSSGGKLVMTAGAVVVSSTVASPQPVQIIDTGQFPRINDFDTIVYVKNGNQVVSKRGTDGVSIVDNGVWADVNNSGVVVYEKLDSNSKSQVWIALRGNGVDLSRVPANWGPILNQYGPRFVVADAWSGLSRFPAQQILSTAKAADPTLKTAAYFILNFSNAAFPTGGSQFQEALAGIGIEAGTTSFMALDLEPPRSGEPPYPSDALSVRNRQKFISDAVRAVQRAGQLPLMYTSRGLWRDITGNTTNFACLPLWDARYDENPDLATDGDPRATPLPWNSYGGWSQRSGKQYNAGCPDGPGLCNGIRLPGGGTIDLNVFDPGLFGGFTWGNPSDLPAAVAVSRSGFRFNNATRRFVQTVTVTNTGSIPILGPVSIVLEGLTPGVAIFNREGVTSVGSQPGSSFLNIYDPLRPGQAVTTTLEFSNPSNLGINYTPQFYGCPGIY